MIRITDGTGGTAATYSYDPYGVQTSAESPKHAEPVAAPTRRRGGSGPMVTPARR